MSRRPLRRGNWAVQELERLRDLLPRLGVQATALLLRRSPESVQRRATALLRVPPRRGDWTDEDDRRLRASWGAVDQRLLAGMLGRSVPEVRRRAAELQRRLRQGDWTPAEIRLLKQLYGSRSDADLEICLLRAHSDVAAMAARLCLAKNKRFRPRDAGHEPAVVLPRGVAMPRWTAAEQELLRQLYPQHDNLAVARRLGRSVSSVANKANQMGLRKSGQLLAEIGRSNVAQRHRRRASAAADGG